MLETDYARRGSRLHNVLAAFHRQWPELRGTGPMAPEEEQAAFFDHLCRVVEKRIAVAADGGIEAALVEIDRRQILKWAQKHFEHHANYAGACAKRGVRMTPAHLEFRFGPPRNRWLPVTGDWDGDGKDTVGFYDQAKGLFRLKNRLEGGDADVVVRFGLPKAGWIPVAGDWDGDGKDGIGLFVPATSVFLLKDTLDHGPADWEIHFGPPAAGRIPLSGEW